MLEFLIKYMNYIISMSVNIVLVYFYNNHNIFAQILVWHAFKVNFVLGVFDLVKRVLDLNRIILLGFSDCKS